MKRLIALGVTAVALSTLAWSASASADPPPPSFSRPICTVGGDTSWSWRHLRVTSVSVDWYRSGDVFVSHEQDPVHGTQFSTPTPTVVDDGGSAVMTLNYDGGSITRTAPCTA